MPPHLEVDSVVRLPDGRLLAYLEVGWRDGPVVIHCHGSGSSRLEALFLAEAAREVGIRLFALDRPGVGRSDPHPYSNIAEWTGDIAQFADQLGLHEFAVQGMSNGGPYALACAYRFPQRLRACGLISTVSPSDIARKAGSAWVRLALWMGQDHPRVFRWLIRRMISDKRLTPGEGDKQIRTMTLWMSEADRRGLRNAGFRALLARTLAEHRRQGAVGGRYEAEVGMRPWGFAPSDVSFDRLFLWHGEQDRLIPAGQARALVAALPHCKATFFPGEGHFSVLANQAKEILARMK